MTPAPHWISGERRGSVLFAVVKLFAAVGAVGRLVAPGKHGTAVGTHTEPEEQIVGKRDQQEWTEYQETQPGLHNGIGKKKDFCSEQDKHQCHQNLGDKPYIAMVDFHDTPQ